jgi:hypothetical protein
MRPIVTAVIGVTALSREADHNQIEQRTTGGETGCAKCSLSEVLQMTNLDERCGSGHLFIRAGWAV